MTKLARSFGLRELVFLLALAASAPLVPGCSPARSKAVILTAGNFEEKVLKSKGAVLIDFWAEWCGPCKYMDPVIKELAIDFEGKAVIGKLNIDDYPEIADKYGIRAIPTVLVFKNGELKEQLQGVQQKRVLTNLLVDLLYAWLDPRIRFN